MSATTARPDTAAAGKIRCLDFETREEICRRMRDGVRGRALLDWLDRIAPQYAPFNAQNVSNWRKTGFRDWLKHQDKIALIREKAEETLRESRAHGEGIFNRLAIDVAVAVADANEAASPENVAKLAAAASAIIQARTAQVRAEHDSAKVDLSRRALALEERKYRLRFVAGFMKFAEDRRAMEIVAGRESNDVKTDKLGRLIFGEEWGG